MKTPLMPKGALLRRSAVVVLVTAIAMLALVGCTRDRPIEGISATPGAAEGSQVVAIPTSTPVPPIVGEPSVVESSDMTVLDGTPAPTVEGGAADETIDEYIVSSGDTLLSIAIEFGMGVEDLRALNFLESDSIAAGQPLRVRVTPPTPSPTPEPFFYTVQVGDSLGGIAAKFGVGQVDLINANRIVDPNALRVGVDIIIPGYAPEGAAAAGEEGTASEGAVAAGDAVVHVVQVGESLSEIAAQYGVSAVQIAAANGISNPNSVRVGTELTIPGVSAAQVADQNAIRHTVAAGESVSVIAQQYGVTTAEVLAANNILNPNTIKVGQVLIIPQGQ